jgi:hypothetical protein
MRSLLAGLAVAAPFVMGLATTPDSPHATTVLTFQDPAIVEQSALILQDGLFVTTNDSGDTGRLFVVDGSGATVGVTHWSDHPTDTEALAPGGPGYVWVGDIGDNLAQRSDVTITRVPVGRGERTVRETSYHLTYPGGASDAETLVRDPVTDRLYIATKNLFGGRLYAVPPRLSATGTNRLLLVGRVLPIATDGAFFPDGRHLVIRNYTVAAVYAWPSMQRVATFDLPAQPQGEGIAVGPDDTLYLSSEGLHAPVLETRVPAAVRTAMAATPSRSPSATTSSSPGAEPGASTATDEASTREVWPWAAGGLLALAALVVGLLSLRRPRGGPPSGEEEGGSAD